MEQEKTIRIASKLQTIAKQMLNDNDYKYKFVGCENTEDILLSIGSEFWMNVLLDEGYSEGYIKGMFDLSPLFQKLFDKVVVEWERLDSELTSKILN